jgi:hypothetical protein
MTLAAKSDFVNHSLVAFRIGVNRFFVSARKGRRAKPMAEIRGDW